MEYIPRYEAKRGKGKYTSKFMTKVGKVFLGYM